MNIKAFFVAGLSLVLLSSVSFGQQEQWGQGQRRTPDQRAQNQTEWMQKNLNLSQDQNHKVYDIILYYAKEQDSLMTMPKGRDRRTEREGIERDKESELRSVLSADQFSRYQAHVEEMKERMRERRQMQGEGGGNGGN